jgi:hypothetical protein
MMPLSLGIAIAAGIIPQSIQTCGAVPDPMYNTPALSNCVGIK